MRKKILVVFPDEWAAYSPTLQNLVALLRPEHDVEVLYCDADRLRTDALDPEVFAKMPIAERPVHPLTHYLKKRFNENLFAHEHVDCLSMEKIRLLLFHLHGRRPDHVIAFDPLGLFAASILFDEITFASLESTNAKFFRWTNPAKIRDVIVQTPERYRRIFGDQSLNTWFIHNSHIYDGDFPRQMSRTIVYFGNNAAIHGLWIMLDAMEELHDYTLTLKGFIAPDVKDVVMRQYQRLVAENRILFDDDYVPQASVVNAIKDYGIGFCFYDIEYLKKTVRRADSYLIDHFRNCPSGKLFNYHAAGLPVVGNDLPGLSSVREFSAGELVERPEPATIAAAVRTIEKDYDRYVRGSFAAAKAHDFRKLAQPFLSDLAKRPRAEHKLPARLDHALRLKGFLSALDSGLRAPYLQKIAAIERIVKRNSVVLYGLGPNMEFLFHKCDIQRLNITAIATKKGTGVFFGLPIIAPESIPEFASDVVISSYGSEEEIAVMLKKLHGDRVRIHRFHSDE